MTCSLCEKPARYKSWCQMHYMRAYRHNGDPTVVLRGGWGRRSGCAVDGCTNTRHYARGLCRMHYDRARQRGVLGRFTR